MGNPLPSYKCKQAMTDAQLRAAIVAIAECLPFAADVQDIKDELAVCTPLFVVEDIYVRILTAALCYVGGGGSVAPYEPVVQLWDGTSNVTIDEGTNILRLTAPTAASRQITLPANAAYTGGYYVSIDLMKNIGVLFNQTVVPAGADTIAGAATMVPVMGATYATFTSSGTGNWAYQITNNDDPRFYRMFSVLANFGGTVGTPDIKITPCSYNGNDTSWIGHDPTVGVMGGFMIPINVEDPVRCADKFNTATDLLMRHPLTTNTLRPVVALGAGAGTPGAGATIACEGNDTTGWVRVNTGSDATGTGEIWNLTFDAPFTAPPIVMIQAADDDTRTSDADWLIIPISTTTNADFHAVMSTGKTMATSSTYIWRYHTLGGS